MAQLRYVYLDAIKVPGWATTITVGSMLEKFREIGTAHWSDDGNVIGFTLEADDLWELREMADYIADQIGTYAVPYVVDKDKVVRRVAVA